MALSIMFEIGFTNGEGVWVKLYCDFPTRQAAELYRTQVYVRTRTPCDMEIRESTANRQDLSLRR